MGVMRLSLRAFAAVAIACAAAVPAERWEGHVARLAQAKAACQDVLSASCEPYVAEAVGIVDYLDVEHPEGHCEKRNGLDVTRLALILDEKQYFYWSQALIAAAKSVCKIP